MKSKNRCLCNSGRSYAECCEKYHQGVFPEKAEQLMRSRYTAYALGLADYIMETTHPLNPSYLKDRVEWKNQVMEFSKSISFKDLKILEVLEGEEESYVTFRAILFHGEKDVSFTEKSRFLRVNGRWLYVDGVIT